MSVPTEVRPQRLILVVCLLIRIWHSGVRLGPALLILGIVGIRAERGFERPSFRLHTYRSISMNGAPEDLLASVTNGGPAIEMIIVLQPEDWPRELETDWHVRLVKQLTRNMERHEAENLIEQLVVLDGPEFLGNLEIRKVR